jgi:hypothetical protein
VGLAGEAARGVFGRADAERPEGVALRRTVVGDDAEVGEDPSAPERQLDLCALGAGLPGGCLGIAAAAIAGADGRASDRRGGCEHAECGEAATAIDVG